MNSPRMLEDVRTGDWLLTDIYGDVYRIKLTGEQGVPIAVVLEKKKKK